MRAIAYAPTRRVEQGFEAALALIGATLPYAWPLWRAVGAR